MRAGEDMTESIKRGVEQAANGETKDLGSFAHFADEPKLHARRKAEAVIDAVLLSDTDEHFMATEILDRLIDLGWRLG